MKDLSDITVQYVAQSVYLQYLIGTSASGVYGINSLAPRSRAATMHGMSLV
jgi:hypothetical protein